MKCIIYNGKTENIYRYEGLDIGTFTINERGSFLYYPFSTKLKGFILYILKEENKKFDKEKFDEQKCYAGIYDECVFYYKYKVLVEAEEELEEKWVNSFYYILHDKNNITQIIDKDYLKEIEKAFNDDFEISFKKEDSNKKKYYKQTLIFFNF